MSEFSANIVKGYLVGKGIQQECIQTMGMLLMGSEESNAVSNDEKEQSWGEILIRGQKTEN